MRKWWSRFLMRWRDGFSPDALEAMRHEMDEVMQSASEVSNREMAAIIIVIVGLLTVGLILRW